MDCSPPGSSVHGILQARMLEWVACPPPGDLPHSGKEPTSLTSPALPGRFFTTSATGKPLIRPLLGLKQCSDSSLKSNFLSLYSRPAPVVPELFQLSLTTLPSHPEPQSTHPACLLSPTVHQAFPSP